MGALLTAAPFVSPDRPNQINPTGVNTVRGGLSFQASVPDLPQHTIRLPARRELRHAQPRRPRIPPSVIHRLSSPSRLASMQGPLAFHKFISYGRMCYRGVLATVGSSAGIMEASGPTVWTASTEITTDLTYVETSYLELPNPVWLHNCLDLHFYRQSESSCLSVITMPPRLISSISLRSMYKVDFTADHSNLAWMVVHGIRDTGPPRLRIPSLRFQQRNDFQIADLQLKSHPRDKYNPLIHHNHQPSSSDDYVDDCLGMRQIIELPCNKADP